MPYPQDLLGEYVNYKVDPGANMSIGMNNLLVNGLLPGQTTAATVSVYTGGPPGTGPGAMQVVNTNQPWNFTFLKYMGGAVTIAPLTGPVLTGPMSGCYLCKYTQGGQQLAHIGTVNTQEDAKSIQAKQAWLTFVARNDVTAVTGGSPADYFSVGDIQAAMFAGAGIPVVVGYFAGGSAYAMLLAPVPGGKNPPNLHLMKVAALKTMTLQPWSSIAAMRRFQL